MEFQTRSESTGIQMFNSFKEAMEEAKRDRTIWKISFSLETGERIRLVRNSDNEWVNKPIRLGK